MYVCAETTQLVVSVFLLERNYNNKVLLAVGWGNFICVNSKHSFHVYQNTQNSFAQERTQYSKPAIGLKLSSVTNLFIFLKLQSTFQQAKLQAYTMISFAFWTYAF